MLARGRLAITTLLLLFGLASCGHRASERDDRDVDEGGDSEERADGQLNVWRCAVQIVGAGRVSSSRSEIYCASDGTSTHGTCGPHLFRFQEREPPLLRATAAAGWRFDRWESQIRSADGTIRRRQGPMPDSVHYLNGFGYADKGELETVTAVFVAVGR